MLYYCEACTKFHKFPNLNVQGIHHQNALENLAQVSQIERVM